MPWPAQVLGNPELFGTAVGRIRRSRAKTRDALTIDPSLLATHRFSRGLHLEHAIDLMPRTAAQRCGELARR
jgi:hypothetical protein